MTQLERELEDHKDNNAKLQRQLDNWQGLKKGDDADLEILRKKNIELEVQLREANVVIQERDKALEKEKGRTTKLKEVLHEWKTEAEELTTLRNQADNDATNAKKAAEKFEQEVSDLKAQLTAALKTTAAPKSNTTPPIPLASEDADQTRPKPQPKSKPVKRLKPADSDIVELIELPAKAKGKRKASQEDSADEKTAAEKPKRARTKKDASAPNEKAPKNQKKAAESSQAKTLKLSAAVADSAAEDDQDPVPKKKKRKLNVGIFPSTQQQPPVFHWDQDGIGLGIPTELSPVKDAPRRLHPSSTGPSFTKTRG